MVKSSWPRARRRTKSGLAQGVSGPLFTGIRPEDAEESVAALHATGRCDREVGEKTHALRLGENGQDLPPILAIQQVNLAERVELNHRRYDVASTLLSAR